MKKRIEIKILLEFLSICYPISMDYNSLSKEELIVLIEAREKENKDLLSEHEKLKVNFRKAIEERDEALKQIERLLEGQRIERARLYVSKSEITKNVINEAEENTSLDVNKEIKDKKKRGRKVGVKLSDNFIANNIQKRIIDVYPDEKDVISDLSYMGYDVKTKIEMLPIEIRVEEYHIHKYVKDNVIYQKGNEDPYQGYLTPSLLASILYHKYVLGVPLYRLEKSLNDRGLFISRQALSNYVIEGARELYPIYEELYKRLINTEVKVLHADETTLEVLEYKKKENRDKSYMWVYATSTYDQPIYIYDFEKDRSGSNPKEFLKEYKGSLVVDGYDGYNNIDNVSLAGCWAHVKRKYSDIVKGLSSKQRSSSLAVAYIKIIDKLFALENKYKKLDTVDEILKARQKESKPLVNEYFLKIESKIDQCDGKLKEAMQYSINQKDKLVRFLNDGHIPLSNNLAERAVKPFVICRKNFLFSNTHNGAEASAVIFSVIQTAKMNGLDPFMYLYQVFCQIWKTKQKDIEKLLPWSKEMEMFMSFTNKKCQN